MNSTTALASYNMVHLREGRELLSHIDDSTYHVKSPQLHNSTIGEHIRHIVEHYTCFLEGVPNHKIDYDARPRDIKISENREFAIEFLTELITSIDRLPIDDAPLSVKMSTGADDNEASLWSQSTLRRELQYLQAHTTHHYALMSMILRFHGVETGSSFGVSPSTLKHRLTDH